MAVVAFERKVGSAPRWAYAEQIFAAAGQLDLGLTRPTLLARIHKHPIERSHDVR